MDKFGNSIQSRDMLEYFYKNLAINIDNDFPDNSESLLQLDYCADEYASSRNEE